MQVLFFADLHGSKTAFCALEKKAKKAGLIVCLGDFTIFGSDQRKILERIDSFGKLCLLIHGNHEVADEVAKDCKDLKNILFVHQKVLKVAHLIFMGYGGGGFSLRDEAFEKKYAPRMLQTMEKYKVKIGPNAKTVLLLHGPPYGSKVDHLEDHHCGNKSFREFYFRNKLDYVFSGHIHETAGVVESVKQTTLVNPGPKGMLIEM